MFSDVVKLYRAANRPERDGSRFSYEGPYTVALRQAISTCQQLPSSLGYFSDGPNIEGDSVSFEWHVASTEQGRFYANVEDFVINDGRLSAGEEPQNFYIVADDVIGGVEEPTPGLRRALDLGELVRFLGKLAIGRVSQPAAPDRLLFVLPAASDTPPRTLELETRITASSLLIDAPDLVILRDVVRGDAEARLHIHEHRQLLRVAVATVVARRESSSPEDAFTYLVRNWAEVNRLYDYNADCYVQKFSFEKLRGDVAKIQLDFASKVASVLGDGASKLLGLPLSFGGLAAILAVKSYPEAALLVLGTLLVSLLLSGTIHNQLLAGSRVRAGFNLAIGDIHGSASKYPDAMRQPIVEAKRGFEEQYDFLTKVYAWLRPASWAPPILGTLIVLYRFGQTVAPASAAIVVVCALIGFFLARRKRKSDSPKE